MNEIVQTLRDLPVIALIVLAPTPLGAMKYQAISVHSTVPLCFDAGQAYQRKTRRKDQFFCVTQAPPTTKVPQQ